MDNDTTQAMTDWADVRRKAGPNANFSGYSVYCWCSMKHIERDWLRRFRAEAEEHGAELAVLHGHLYVLWDDGSEPPDQLKARRRVRSKRASRNLLRTVRNATDDDILAAARTYQAVSVPDSRE